MKTGTILGTVFAAIISVMAAGNAPAFANPIFDGWYADPQIRRFGDMYWVFPTTSTSFVAQTHFDAFSSRDMKEWTKHAAVIKEDNVALTSTVVNAKACKGAFATFSLS